MHVFCGHCLVNLVFVGVAVYTILLAFRAFLFPDISQKHKNALLRYTVLLIFALNVFIMLPVRVNAVNGAFSRTAKLVAKDGYTEDHFGNAVSVYSTTAMIGAWLDDVLGTQSGISIYSIGEIY
jgi:hypothetical protein